MILRKLLCKTPILHTTLKVKFKLRVTGGWQEGTLDGGGDDGDKTGEMAWDITLKQLL